MLTLHEELSTERFSLFCPLHLLLIFSLHNVWCFPSAWICGCGTKIKAVVEKWCGWPSEESWLSRLSLRVKVEWGELQHLDTIPSWLQLHPLFLCLPSSDKVWADLSHRMFTRGIQCQRLSISIQKNPQNATDLQMCKYTATLTCFVENRNTTYPQNIIVCTMWIFRNST